MGPRQREKPGIKGRPVGERAGHGFTLIELLVVIAVIAVLVALLVPSLSKAREAGRRAACMSNLRELQIAWQIYADEHHGSIVNGPAWYEEQSPRADDHGKPWLVAWDGKDVYDHAPQTYGDAACLMRTGALAPYVGNNARVYLCPNRYRHNRYYQYDKYSGMWGWYWLSSYNVVASMNAVRPSDFPDLAEWERKMRAAHDLGRTALFIKNTSQIVDPGPSSRMVFLDEGGKWDIGKSFVYVDAWIDPPTSMTPLAIHHSNGTCMSFADGHSEYWRWRDPATIAWGHWREDRERLYPAWPATPASLDHNNPDYRQVHRGIWGKEP